MRERHTEIQLSPRVFWIEPHGFEVARDRVAVSLEARERDGEIEMNVRRVRFRATREQVDRDVEHVVAPHVLAADRAVDRKREIDERLREGPFDDIRIQPAAGDAGGALGAAPAKITTCASLGAVAR